MNEGTEGDVIILYKVLRLYSLLESYNPFYLGKIFIFIYMSKRRSGEVFPDEGSKKPIKSSRIPANSILIPVVRNVSTEPYNGVNFYWIGLTGSIDMDLSNYLMKRILDRVPGDHEIIAFHQFKEKFHTRSFFSGYTRFSPARFKQMVINYVEDAVRSNQITGEEGTYVIDRLFNEPKIMTEKDNSPPTADDWKAFFDRVPEPTERELHIYKQHKNEPSDMTRGGRKSRKSRKSKKQQKSRKSRK